MKTCSQLVLLVALPLSLAQREWGPPSYGRPSGWPMSGSWSWPHWPSTTTAVHATSPVSSPTSTPASGGGGSGGGNTQDCTPLTTSEIESMGNNSLFTRWRPHSHIIAPAGWSNDPNGPVYDPTRDIYHMFYQWHPQHINWGNISWGHAVSKDQITWTDVTGWQGREALALGPTGYGHYNGLGIFSGTAQPVNLKGQVDGTLLIMYTSVAHLPTSWNIPYTPYTETQSLAYSTDGGTTWIEYAGNPVINTTTNMAPEYWNFTGFRDPFLQPSPALDAVIGVSEPHYYAVFGSGIKGVGPRIPLWTAPASDLTSWTFLGALWEPADNSSLGPVLSTGSYGYNFEVSGFFSLADSNGELHWFVNMGTEGGNVSFHESAHWALWNEGLVSRRENGSIEFTPVSGGAGDWGLAYAILTFNDTKHDRRVQIGWAEEDLVGDGGLFSASQQGFQGSLTLQREVFVHETPNVLNVPNGSLSSSKSAVLRQNQNGTFTAYTLGVRPLADVVAGIVANATHKSYGNSVSYTSSKILEQQGDAHMELKATVSAATGAVGLIIAASPDGTEYTTISYQPSNSTIIVDRSHSTTIAGFNNASVTGYFAPYTYSTPSGPQQESITMDVFVDGSLVEVYVNDRFALSTRIYPSMQCSTGFGVYVEAGAQATFESVEAWMGTLNVWPERPLNSSSPLVWDTPEQTNNYTWWSGN